MRQVICIKEMQREVFCEFQGKVCVLPKQSHKLEWLFLFGTTLCVAVKPGSMAALLHPPDSGGRVDLESLDWVMSGHCPAPCLPAL